MATLRIESAINLGKFRPVILYSFSLWLVS
jgi:hypothetical protein